MSFAILSTFSFAVALLFAFSLLVWIPQRANPWFGRSLWVLNGLSPHGFAPLVRSALSKVGLSVEQSKFDLPATAMCVSLSDGRRVLIDLSCWNRTPRLDDWVQINTIRRQARADDAWVIRSKMDGMGTTWLISQGFEHVQHRSLSQLIQWLNLMSNAQSRSDLKIA
jgi:hypothetical protein